MDRDFQYAVHSARKDKIKFFKSGGYLCLKINDVRYSVGSFNFYKVPDMFNEDIVVITTKVLGGVPTLKIPIPSIRRTAKFDNKFFLTSVRKANSTYHEKTATLYAPFLYFYFEESQFEEIQGYVSNIYPKYSSKLDRNINFIDFNRSFEREDDKLKKEAIEMFTQIEELEKQIKRLGTKLYELDPNGRVEEEFKEMRNKLMQAMGDEE